MFKVLVQGGKSSLLQTWVGHMRQHVVAMETVQKADCLFRPFYFVWPSSGLRVNTNMLRVDKDSCTYPDERRHSVHSNFPVSCQLQTTAVTLVACRSYKLYPKFILAGGKKKKKKIGLCIFTLADFPLALVSSVILIHCSYLASLM